MKYHLYVDESGTFNREQNTVSFIGGFLLPERKSVNPRNLCRDWWEEETKELNSIYGEALSDYKLDHCSENRRHPHRRDIQLHVLDRVGKKLIAAGGKVVLFHNTDSGFAGLDNTNFFLTILAKGLFFLLLHLKNEDKTGNPELIVHAAVRRDETLNAQIRHIKETEGVDDEEALSRALRNPEIAVSPTQTADAHMEANKMCYILREQYNAQIKNNITLINSGFYQEDCVQFMLKNIEIVHGNPPSVIICDYLCNTYFQGLRNTSLQADEVFRRTYVSENCLIYDICMNRVEPVLFQENQKPNFTAAFLALLKLNMPSVQTVDFFKRLEVATVDEQDQFVLGFNHAIQEIIYNEHRDCLLLTQQLNHLVKLFRSHLGNNALCARIEANLQMFLYALYNHTANVRALGTTEAALKTALRQMKNAEERRELMIMLLNRKIVFCTDNLDYDAADQAYEKIKDVFAARQMADEMLLDDTEDVKNPQFGRASGSYLGLQRQLLRQASTSDREDIYQTKVLTAMKVCMENFSTPEDMSRLHQNMAWVDTEAGYHEDAFNHLICACFPEQPEALPHDINPANCRRILDYTGALGENRQYIFNTYTNLMHTLLLNADERGRMMLDAIEKLAHDFTASNTECLTSEDVKVMANMRLAGCIAMVHGTAASSRAAGLFRKAVKSASEAGQPLFDALAVCAKAEEIALMLENKLTERNLTQHYQELNALHRRFETHASQVGIRLEDCDPFARCKFSAEDGNEMIKIALRLAY